MSRRQATLEFDELESDSALRLLVDVAISPYIPGRTSGPPEDCYPAEGGEIEITAVWLEDAEAPNSRLEISPLLTFFGAWDKLQPLVDAKCADLPDDDGPDDYPSTY